METKQARELLARHLAEARANEIGGARALAAHISMTPPGQYRLGLERHLRESKEHAKQVGRRAEELRGGRSTRDTGANAVKGLVSQVFSLAKAPIDLLVGSGGEELLLRKAYEGCALEAYEIATYDAIEALAVRLDDERTAELARSIRDDEERMFDELRQEIPNLADGVVKARVEGVKVYDAARTGAARDVRSAGKSAQQTAKDVKADLKAQAGGAAKSLRKVPGVARAEGELKGAVASAEDLPIRDYETLSAQEVSARLGALSRIDLSKIHGYELRHQGRKSILERSRSCAPRSRGPVTTS
jgi:ferritin-like metal-binding protein YciE